MNGGVRCKKVCWQRWILTPPDNDRQNTGQVKVNRPYKERGLLMGFMNLVDLLTRSVH